MKYMLLPLWGSFGIQSYGTCIALALLLFMWIVPKDTRFQKLQLEDDFFHLISLGIIVGLVGGRLLYVFSHMHQMHSLFNVINIFEGGLSILGCIIGLMIVGPAYLYYKKIPIFPFFDLMTTYTLLVHAVARLGCFLAGCCYGKATDLWCAVKYTDPLCVAPLNVWIHPTQLYSAALCFIGFLLMYYILRHRLHKPGQLTSLYLLFISFERFMIDFWRADRIMEYGQFLSFYQWIALALMVGSLGAFIVVSSRRVPTLQSHI